MDTVLEHKEEFIRLNKAQMYRGENKLGGNMRSYRWDSYAQFKQGLNSQPPYGVRDNYRTGDFYSGFYLTAVNDKVYRISSLDEKTTVIENKSGGDIFGLNPESKKEIKTEFALSLVKRVKDATS